MNKKYIYLLILSTILSACSSIKHMIIKEKTLINSGDVNTPFRVLKTDNSQDSLFLREKSIDIENVKEIATNKDWQHFIERLKLTMAVESGVGIAAPQVGIHRKVFAFMRLDKPGRPIQIAINPEIKNVSEEIIDFEGDGCLSVPDISGSTKRYAWIDVEYYDSNGVLIKERLWGNSRQGNYTGIIFQHEFDHLNGILFTDRLSEDKAESTAK